MVAQTLIHIDRRCASTLNTEALSEEVGEDFRLATHAMRHSPLCRYRLPIHATWPLGPHRAFQPEYHAARLLEHFGPDLDLDLFALRRAARKLTRALAGALPRSSHALDPSTPRLIVALGQDHLYAGRISPRDAGAWDAGNLAPRYWLSQRWISRAAVKWLESAMLFRLHGLEPAWTGHWLELGAAPGGITAALLHGGAQVTAVDLAPLELSPHPRLRAVVGDARDAPLDARYQGLICDINGPPQIALEAVLRAVPMLEPGALVAHTLKLPQWSLRTSLVQRTVQHLEDAGLTRVAIRHFVSHGQELAILARRMS